MAVLSSSFFALTWTFGDKEQVPDLVALRYTWCGVGQAPDWSREHATVLAAVHGNGRHVGAVWLPRGVEEAPNYSVHFYFLSIVGGRQRTSPTGQREIVRRKVTFRPVSGREPVAIEWSLDQAPPNYSSFTADAPSHTFHACVWGPLGSTVYYLVQSRHTGQPMEGDRIVWDTNAGRPWRLLL